VGVVRVAVTLLSGVVLGARGPGPFRGWGPPTARPPTLTP
jgi:hypothetical protein